MAISNHNCFVLEMNSLIKEAKAAMTAECCCIYRVPDHTRRLNEDSFTPKVVSIGPFHYAHPRLQNMEKYKLLFFDQFCQRISSNLSLNTLISFVQDIEPNIHLYYSQPIKLNTKELAKMILLDSCFLFELFWRSFYEDWDGVTELIPWLDTAIRLDLLLLENQLPFPVLENLFRRVFPNSTTNNGGNPSFLHLTFDYFKHYNTMKLHPQGVSVSHFTDLLRTFYLPPSDSQLVRLFQSATHLQSATELAQAGVTFRKSESSSFFDFKFSRKILEFKFSRKILGFKFSRQILEIPKLEVDDWTEIWLRNLVVLEQCHYPFNSYITDYVTIMDFLINTSSDVDLLVQKEIIVNWLGDTNSVANLFNSLGKNVTNVNFNSHFSKICEDVNAFCKSPWNKRKATLRHDYCNTPWKTAASLAGILLLLLSLVQTAASILQVVQQYKPSSSH